MESVTQSKTECMEELTSHDFELSRACSHFGGPFVFQATFFPDLLSPQKKGSTGGYSISRLGAC